MPTICPNCLHTVRTESKYCGFCGTDLNPTAHNDAAVAIATPQDTEDLKDNPIPQEPLKPKGNNARRVILIVLIVLLCLVLLLAFLLHYWPVLKPYTDAILSILRLR